MSMKRMRMYLAGLVAFLVGIPLTEQAFAQTGDILEGAWQLGLGIANLAGRS